MGSGRAARHRFGPEDAKRFYDRIGAWQDTQVYERKAVEHLLAHSDFEHASSVFELGCGTGKLAEDLLKNHLADDATYVGIDISTTMIGLATRRLARWGARATVRQADGTTKLPYPDGSFDRFVSTYVLDLLPEPAIDHVLNEAYRLLRANGKLCVITSTEGITGVSRVVTAIWKRAYAWNPRMVGGCRPLRVSTLLDGANWKIEHGQVVCSCGICSEIVIAFPA